MLNFVKSGFEKIISGFSIDYFDIAELLPFARVAIVVAFYVAVIVIALCTFGKESNKRQKEEVVPFFVNSQERRSLSKGIRGEIEVGSRLNRLGKQYKVINDVMLDNSKRTSQIDHIVVSPFGIFVIETKNYSGTLSGTEYDNYIAHDLGSYRYMIYNPIKQNNVHLRMLMNELGINDRSLFIPILAVSDNCNCDVETHVDIAHFSNVCDCVRKYKRRLLSENDVWRIAKTIREMNVVDECERRKHVERAKMLNECPF